MKNEREFKPKRFGVNKFGRKYDGRVGVIVCSICQQDKKKEEVTQIKDNASYVQVCDNCLSIESEKELENRLSEVGVLDG